MIPYSYGMPEAPNTVSALLRKRAQIAGEVEHYNSLVRQKLIDLDALDQTIRIFRPDIDLEDVRPKPFPPRHAAYKGEVSRVVLETLRNARKPLTTAELAAHVMASRGMNTADKKLARTMTKRVGAGLRHHRKSGAVTSKRGTGGLLVWQTAAKSTLKL